MSIFAKQIVTDDQNDSSLKVLFLHGLEGSPEGVKATYLKQHWNALTPILRTTDLRLLSEKYPGTRWVDMPKREMQDAMASTYADALAAIAYLKPDIVIGSSMGGALLAKSIADEKYSGPAIFLAPAIDELCTDIRLPEKTACVWVLGELDDIISNVSCVRRCIASGGSLMMSIADDHRLHKALRSKLIDCAIITALQLDEGDIL